jgi:Chitin binding Peritrophin-A domain
VAVTIAQELQPVPLKFSIDHAIERPKSIVDFNSDLQADSAGHLYNARQYSEQQYSAEQESGEVQQQQQYPQRRQQFVQKPAKKQYQKVEEEIEEEEPDRLTTLLPKSTFKCDDHTTGYYADESLGCEVFHYCQGSQKHSWVCPEGFTFHQVHLICMPPSNENICEQSSKYHIVNEYLYKPINMKEFESKPNITLR